MKDYFKMAIADEDGVWNVAILDNFPDGTPVDIWAYLQCKVIAAPRSVPFKIQVEGRRVDYNPTAFGATVVSRRMADLLDGICPKDIQRIPAIVNGKTGEWEVINVLPCVDCIDNKASNIQYFPAKHPKAGKPRSIFPLVLDPSRIGQHQLFHPKDWEVATIVSEDVKKALEEICATGMEYVLVSHR